MKKSSLLGEINFTAKHNINESKANTFQYRMNRSAVLTKYTHGDEAAIQKKKNFFQDKLSPEMLDAHIETLRKQQDSLQEALAKLKANYEYLCVGKGLTPNGSLTFILGDVNKIFTIDSSDSLQSVINFIESECIKQKVSLTDSSTESLKPKL